ncbi:MAG: hypothetical protein E7396_03875 [Ruminococcaceae bacterium]|nr:hypothetical protein [Oscillospiraceae bacterium]
MNTVFTKTYAEPEYNTKEILRYSASDISSDEIKDYARKCIDEARSDLIYKVCYMETDVAIRGNTVDFGLFKAESKNLSYTLRNSHRAIIFCATVGIKLDRLIAKYMKSDVAKAFMLQAIGTERCESLCDTFINDMKNQYKDKDIFFTPRFSPGYGDLKIDTQKDIFGILDLPRKIGVTLNDSLIISPSKSVTAIVGLSETDCGYSLNKCKNCNIKECTFRQ